jgi:hypothetical protein
MGKHLPCPKAFKFNLKKKSVLQNIPIRFAGIDTEARVEIEVGCSVNGVINIFLCQWRLGTQLSGRAHILANSRPWVCSPALREKKQKRQHECKGVCVFKFL